MGTQDTTVAPNTTATEADKTQEQPITVSSEDSQEDAGGQAIDYKEELKKTQERLRKAEYTLAKKNMDEKNNLSSSIDSEEVDRLLDEKLETKLKAIREVEAQDDIEDEIFRVTENPDERELIRFIYQNRIVKTGFSRSAIREDLQSAKLLANAKKYQKENVELTESLRARASLGNAGSGTGVDTSAPTGDENLQKHFSSRDWDFMQDRGWPKERIKMAADRIKAARMGQR